jgi:hypothetical protein
MVAVQTLGLMMSDPQRGHVALHALADALTVPSDIDGVGQGSCVDGSVLLRRHPTAPDDLSSFGALLGPLKARCTVVQIRRERDLRPKLRSPTNLGPFRWKQLSFAASGGPTSGEAAVGLRDAYLDTLPDFLRRSIEGQTEAEGFFFAALARLHDSGALKAPKLDAEQVVVAVRETIEAHCADVPRHTVIATGTEIVHVAHMVPAVMVRVEGLDLDKAEAVDPTLVDSSMGRERLRRFRGVFVAGAGELGEVPAELKPLPADAALVIARDLEAREL